MPWRAWRPTISQIFHELKHYRPIDPRSTCKGLYSSLSHQPHSADGIGMKYGSQVAKSYGKHWMIPFSVRTLASDSATHSHQQTRQEKHSKDIAAQEDPFDPLTDRIPEKPVTFAEGASYSLVIFAGLAIAAGAAYAVFKELIFEPKEYKIFGKALERVQNDSQVKVRIGSPITGYGQESRNRVARQRIPHRAWTDEDGIERVENRSSYPNNVYDRFSWNINKDIPRVVNREVNFYIRGPHGAGKVYSEMFKDKTDRKWKFTYLIVDIMSPSPTQLMLESYVPT